MSKFEDLIGKKIFIRTVTFHSIGEVESIFEDKFIKLKGASWIADSGRFSDALEKGVEALIEVEPTKICYINIDSIVDFFNWDHDLPTEQK